MPLSLAALRRVRTREEVRDGIFAALSAVGFQVTSWGDAHPGRQLVEVFSQGVVDLWAGAAAVANGALLVYSEGDWLTELARSAFQIERAAATFAAGYVRLTALAGVGPYQIQPAALVVSDGARYYRSTNTGMLVVPTGGFVDVPVRAESPGSAYNQPTLNVLVSPALPGVSVTSPAWGSGATWRTADGRDEETDQDLRARCVARWATLGRGATIAAYRFLATTCPTAPGVTRAAVIPGGGDGSVAIYLATSSGPASPSEATAVAAWLAPLKPATDTLTVAPAAAVPVTITATVKTRDTSSANLQLVNDALTALQRRLALGEDVDIGAIYAACYAARDVVDVALAAPSGDTVVGPTAVATLTWGVTLEAP